MPKLKPLQASKTDEASPLADFCRQLEQYETLNYAHLLDLVTDGTATPQRFPHQLGRVYKGGHVTGSSALSMWRVLLPADVVALGGDPAKSVYVEPSAAVVMTFSLMVF
jgi:hypothetical protein